jgi:hypothetical protein
MQAYAEEARGQLPYMNGKGGDCWVVAIACAANGWHQPLTIGSHHFSMVRQPTMPNLAAMFDSRTSGVAPQMPIKEA